MEDKTKQNIIKRFDKAYDSFNKHIDDWGSKIELYVNLDKQVTMKDIDECYTNLKKDIKDIRRAKKDIEDFT